MANLQSNFNELLECLKLSQEVIFMLIQFCRLNGLDIETQQIFLKSHQEINRRIARIEEKSSPNQESDQASAGRSFKDDTCYGSS